MKKTQKKENAHNITMSIFKKRETPVENIAFLGIISALLAIVSLVASFIPLAFLGVAILSPLIAAIASYYAKDRYIIVFALSASLLCLMVTLYNYNETIFGVIPGIISGSFFGFLLKKKMPSSLIITLSSILQFALNYLGLLLIKALTDINIIETGIALLGLNGRGNINYFVPCFIYTYALAESSISFLVIEGALEHFGEKETSWYILDKIMPCISLTLLGLALGFAFLLPPLAYVFMAIGIYLSLTTIPPVLKKHSWLIYFLLCIVEFAAGYLVAAFYSYFPADTGLILISTFFASLDIFTLLLLRDSPK